MIKILYRPQRATIDESMQEIKDFESIKDMAEYLSEFWDCAVDDIYVSYYYYDGRIGWETYVVTVGETEKENYCKQYGCPQAIGFMTIIEDKIESGELISPNDVGDNELKDITEYLDLILQAKEEAFKRNIRANSIAINKNLVEVKETILPNAILSPMICGLEIVTVNDLPDNYAFAVYESKRTREEVLIEKVRKETAREILLLLGKGFDETARKDFKDLQWYKQFCRELELRYGIDLEDEE